MKLFSCPEMMCDHCVSRINTALTGAGIEHEIDLAAKTVSIGGSESEVSKAVELLDDLGFSAEACE